MALQLQFSTTKLYREWAKANPTCTCDYDDYGGDLQTKADCPMHGEKRQMQGYDDDRAPIEGPRSDDHHAGVHDYSFMCESPPRCLPVADSPPGTPSSYRPPPDHYSTGAGIDPWQVWDAFDLDRYTANAVKYLLRAGKKDIAPRLDDLKKARDYVNKAIEREENK